MLSIWEKHEIVDTNIHSASYCQKFCGMHKIPNVLKIQFFPAENIFFQFFDKFLNQRYIMEYHIDNMLSLK